MHRHKKGVQAEYRQLERERVAGATSLAGQFPQLKTLRVDLTYYRPDEIVKTRQLKYDVNLQNAKSVFLVGCPNMECTEGDFDLTAELAEAVARQQPIVTGEIHCRGWEPQITAGRAKCQTSLQYKFFLTYVSGKS